MFALFPRAIVSFRAIADAASQRIGRTLGHLFLLVMLSTVAITLLVTVGVRRFAREVEPHLDGLPTVTIRGGKASADVPQPWRKELGVDASGNKMAIIIDTTGQTTGFQPNEAGFLLKQESMTIKDERQTREVELSRFEDMVVGPEQLHTWMRKLVRWVPWVMAIAGTIWYSLAKTVHVFLLVLAALVASSTRRRKLGFGELFTLATLGLTPSVILDAALTLGGVVVPGFWVFYLGLGMTWTALATRAVPDDDGVLRVS